MRIPKIVNSDIRSYLSQSYGSLSESQTKIIVKTAFSHLKQKSHLTTNEIKADVLAGNSCGLIKAVDEVVFSEKSPWKLNLKFKDERQKTIYSLLVGNIQKLKEISSQSDIFPALLFKKNPKTLGEARELLNDVFEDIFQQIEGKNLSPSENLHLEAIIGNFFASYAVLGPKDGEELKVPVQIKGEWNLAVYNVEKIVLTPSWMGSPLVAYGLTSKTPDAPPLLLFKGSTYPTDEGFSLSILTDFNPGASVGAYGFHIGKKKLISWLQANTTPENKVIIFGKSLGGAHAWRTALQIPEYVKKSICIAPPGFSRKDLATLKKLNKAGRLPEIDILSQKNDPVQYIGHIAKEGVNYYQVLGKRSKNGILAHTQMNATKKRSIILNKPLRNGMKRTISSTILAICSITFFPFLLIPHAGATLLRRIGSKLKKI